MVTDDDLHTLQLVRGLGLGDVHVGSKSKTLTSLFH